MGNYWWWLILSGVTGNPILALGLLLVGGWALDQVTLGILPSPLRLYRRWRRAGQLERELAINPHNRKSRFELADLYLDQRRPARALEVLKPNVAAGDDDAATLYLMGRAAYGSGHPKEAETFLAAALERDPEYRLGAIQLEQGRGRLAHGDAQGARAALEQVCARRRGTVEGKVLLARACEAVGDRNRAAQHRREAWADYASSPRFIRRQERWWAWRLQPWRPVALVLAALLLAAGLAHLAPSVTALARGRPRVGPLGTLAAPAWTAEPRVRAPHLGPGERLEAARFVRLPAAEALRTSQLRTRWDPADQSPAGRQRAEPGDMLCRLWALYGKPDPTDGFAYVFRDTRTGVVFTAYSAGDGPAYGAAWKTSEERARAEATVDAFDALLDATRPVDCRWRFEGELGPYESGVRGGKVYTEPI